MKTFTRLLTLTLLTISPLILNAQGGDPPPPPSEHGSQQNLPPGGGAPIGSGLVILLTFGTIYGGRKLYEMKKRSLAG